MAQMADSERTIWSLIDQNRALQQVVAVVARRHAGVLVIDPGEIASLPSNLTLVTSTRADGRLVICAVEPDEPFEPGRPG